MELNNFEKYLKWIQNKFDSSLDSLKKDELFIHNKELIYTNHDKIRIRQKWSKIKKIFILLRKIIDEYKYKSLLKRDFNSFLITYYCVNKYYQNLSRLNKIFWVHDFFIRQILDEKFKYNYNSVARYMYRYKFFYLINYPISFVLLFRWRVDKNLNWIFDDIKNWKELKLDKRIFFDKINIKYYFKYKILKVAYYIVKFIWKIFSNISLKWKKWWLITKKNLEKYIIIAEPWDILLTRINWVWTNVSIPWFWKHMAMYIWTWKYINKNFSKFLKFNKLDKNKHYIIESIWLWVRIIEFYERAKKYDYLSSIRTNFSEEKKFRAIKSSLKNIWMKYDYIFNYYSDKSFVCSELITKSFLKENKNDEWLSIKLEKIPLWITYPPNNLVKKMDEEKNLKEKQLNLIIFLDSNNKKQINFINNDLNDFYKSWKRSRFSYILK